MAELDDLDIVDANNNGSAANAGFPEDMPFANVNNAARALEGMVARWLKDNNGSLDTTGSSNAYLLAPNRTISAYARGQEFEFEANHTNTGAATLNVSSLGAKTIQKTDGAALGAGDIQSGGVYKVIYDGTVFQLVGATAGSITLTSTSTVDLTDGDNVLNIGASTGQHLAMDGNDIQSKSNATTAAALNINALGGDVNIGPMSGNGSIVVRDDTNIVFGTHGNGVNVLGGTTDNPFIQFFQDDGTTRNGFIQFRADTGMVLTNEAHGTSVTIQGEDAGGVLRTLFTADPDAGVSLHYGSSGILPFATEASGVAVRDTSGANPTINLLEDNNTVLSQVFHSSGLVLKTLEHGGTVSLQGEDSGGTNRNLVVGDPDNSVSLYYTGIIALYTEASGISVRDTSGAVPTINLRDDANTALAQILHSSGSGLVLRSIENGATVSLQGENTAGTLVNIFTGDPDNDAHIYYAGVDVLRTQADGIVLKPAAAGNTGVIFEDSVGATEGIIFHDETDLYIDNNEHGGEVIIRGENLSGTAARLFAGDPDNVATLYYAGTARLSTASAGASISGSRLEVDNSGAATQADVLIRNNEGGVQLRADGDTFQLWQTSNTGSAEDQWLRAENNGRVSLYNNNVEEFRTQDSDGSHNTSGAQTKDHGGILRDIGFNVMPVVEQDAAVTLNEDHVGKILHKDSAGAITYTLPSGTSGTVPPVGAVVMIANEDTENLTISAAGTLRWFSGDGVPSTGNRTLAQGGVCSVYHYSSAEWHIWGNGIA